MQQFLPGWIGSRETIVIEKLLKNYFFTSFSRCFFSLIQIIIVFATNGIFENVRIDKS